MPNRREFLQGSALALTALQVGAPGSAQAAPADSVAVHGPALLAPVGVGSELGLGWTLRAIYPPTDGAITLTITHEDGRHARVDVCRREGEAFGPAWTDALDFVVMDGGDGAAPMHESLGRVLRKLAVTVAKNEPGRVALSTHRERRVAYAESLAVAAHRLAPGVG